MTAVAYIPRWLKLVQEPVQSMMRMWEKILLTYFRFNMRCKILCLFNHERFSKPLSSWNRISPIIPDILTCAFTSQRNFARPFGSLPRPNQAEAKTRSFRVVTDRLLYCRYLRVLAHFLQMDSELTQCAEKGWSEAGQPSTSPSIVCCFSCDSGPCNWASNVPTASSMNSISLIKPICIVNQILN